MIQVFHARIKKGEKWNGNEKGKGGKGSCENKSEDSERGAQKGKQSVERNEGLGFEKWTSPKRDEYLLEGRGSKGLAVL